MRVSYCSYKEVVEKGPLPYRPERGRKPKSWPMARCVFSRLCPRAHESQAYGLQPGQLQNCTAKPTAPQRLIYVNTTPAIRIISLLCGLLACGIPACFFGYQRGKSEASFEKRISLLERELQIQPDEELDLRARILQAQKTLEERSRETVSQLQQELERLGHVISAGDDIGTIYIGELEKMHQHITKLEDEAKARRDRAGDDK